MYVCPSKLETSHRNLGNLAPASSGNILPAVVYQVVADLSSQTTGLKKLNLVNKTLSLLKNVSRLYTKTVEIIGKKKSAFRMTEMMK